jgi:hypothetical protein
VKFCIDTSALLDGWVRYYPPQIFPSLWNEIDVLIEEKTVLSTEEVLHELEKKADEVYVWAKQRDEMFLPINEVVQIEVSQILARFPRLVDERKNRSIADPFVIAQAIIEGCIVVTAEKASHSLDKPRIPDVCRELHIECIDFLGLIRRNSWQF